MRRDDWRASSIAGSIALLSVGSEAHAQRCAPVQAAGVVVSDADGPSFAELRASAGGVAVAWTSNGRSYARPLDPVSLAPRSAARIVGDASASTVALSSLEDGSIIASSCTCSANTSACSSVALVGRTTPPSFEARLPARCLSTPFAAVATRSSLAAIVAAGPARALHLIGYGATRALPAARGFVRPALVPLSDARLGVVLFDQTVGTQALLFSQSGSRGAPIVLADAQHTAVAPIRWGSGMLTVTTRGAQNAEHDIVTVSATGAVARRPLSLVAVDAGASRAAFDIVKAIAPSTAECFLIAWTQASQEDLFVGRVCDNRLVQQSVGVLHAPDMTTPVLASSDAHAYVAWTGSPRSPSNRTRVALLGCH
ncbi:MAG: hypothetical protein JNK05_36105 [Myxococcales bacterium]|nr:hypothetical protein [Myxococcales bacterium]